MTATERCRGSHGLMYGPAQNPLGAGLVICRYCQQTFTVVQRRDAAGVAWVLPEHNGPASATVFVLAADGLVSPTAEAVALVKELATGGEPVVSDWDMGPDGGPRYTCGCCGAYGYPLPLTHADDCLWRRAVALNERLGETP